MHVTLAISQDHTILGIVWVKNKRQPLPQRAYNKTTDEEIQKGKHMLGKQLDGRRAGDLSTSAASSLPSAFSSHDCKRKFKAKIWKRKMSQFYKRLWRFPGQCPRLAYMGEKIEQAHLKSQAVDDSSEPIGSVKHISIFSCLRQQWERWRFRGWRDYQWMFDNVKKREPSRGRSWERRSQLWKRSWRQHSGWSQTGQGQVCYS